MPIVIVLQFFGKVENNRNHTFKKVLVGNKKDREEDQMITKPRGIRLSRIMGCFMDTIETSIEDIDSIRQLFHRIQMEAVGKSAIGDWKVPQ